MGLKDLIAHARMERDKFKKLATAKRKEWLSARKERRWMDALQAQDRMHEYRAAARDRQSFIDQHKDRP